MIIRNRFNNFGRSRTEVRAARASIVSLASTIREKWSFQPTGSCPGYCGEEVNPLMGFETFPWIEIGIENYSMEPGESFTAFRDAIAAFNLTSKVMWIVARTEDHPDAKSSTYVLRTLAENLTNNPLILGEMRQSTFDLANWLKRCRFVS